MVMMTFIARLADGVPLSASIHDDEQSGKTIQEYQNQAKMLVKKLNFQSPTRCSIETGSYLFHYLIEKGVFYLILCERTFSKRMAFQYLEDIQGEFNTQYGNKVPTVSRPYPFMDFEKYIQKAQKSYSDSRVRRTFNTLNNELQDVQRIMVQNIDDVLQRGVAISELDSKAGNLAMLSQKYKKDARYLNLRSLYAKAAAGCVVVFVIFLYFWVL